jgi:chloramphenicol 3-O-phosphotransferase
MGLLVMQERGVSKLPKSCWRWTCLKPVEDSLGTDARTRQIHAALRARYPAGPPAGYGGDRVGVTPAESIRTGTAILLNGTSSAGKTTLARELQGLLTDSYLHVEAEPFSRMMRHGRYDAVTFLATRCAMNSFVAVLAARGLDSVVDTLLTTRTWLKDCVDKLADYRVLFVGVLCPSHELERRERARSDRRIGLN